MLTVAVICDVLGSANNGTTIAALNLIDSLRSKGHDVRVVCPDTERSGEPGWYVVPCYDFGIFNGYMRKNGVVPAKADSKILESAVAGADVIHVMLPFSLGAAAARYASEHGIPLTAGFHCQAENITSHIYIKGFTPANRLVYRIFYKRLYRYCSCIHYPTQFICDVFESIVGPTPHRIISNGVSRSFRPGESEKHSDGLITIVFTGRYSPEKSHDVLVDAVAMSKYKDRIRLIFAGSGPRKNAILRRAKRRGIREPEMRFFSRGELVGIMQSADLYVHPADIEIEAIACLEAIACGCVPVISDSPKSATRYFALTGNNLFRHGDPKDLADRIDWWLDRPDEMRICSERYVGYAKQFDFGNCMDAMENMLLEAAGEKKHEA